jgi:hypothetical protein
VLAECTPSLTRGSKGLQYKKGKTTERRKHMNLQDLLFKPAELKAGETKLINGAITMCINPQTCHGPLWAIKGRCAMFSVDGHNGYIKALCSNVSPNKGFITMEIIKGPHPRGTVLNITLDEVRRYQDVEDDEDAYLKRVLAASTALGVSSTEPPLPSLMEVRHTKECEQDAQDELMLKSLIGAETYQWLERVSRLNNELNASVRNNPSMYIAVAPTATTKLAKKLQALLAKQPLQNQ